MDPQLHKIAHGWGQGSLAAARSFLEGLCDGRPPPPRGVGSMASASSAWPEHGEDWPMRGILGEHNRVTIPGCGCHLSKCLGCQLKMTRKQLDSAFSTEERKPGSHRSRRY